jgi:hypothetical protein
MRSPVLLLLLLLLWAVTLGEALSESHQAAIDNCETLKSGQVGRLESLPPGSTSIVSTPCLWLSSVDGRRVLRAAPAGPQWNKGGLLIAAPQLRALPPEHQQITWFFDLQEAKGWNTRRWTAGDRVAATLRRWRGSRPRTRRCPSLQGAAARQPLRERPPFSGRVAQGANSGA